MSEIQHDKPDAVTGAPVLKVFLYQQPSVFCDQGIHAGLYRVDFKGKVYLTEEEAVQLGSRDLVVSLPDPEAP
jgi:hypothetical protein